MYVCACKYNQIDLVSSYKCKCRVFAALLQVVFVGGLFPQFRLDRNKEDFIIDQGGVRRMAAALLAFDRVNNKTDGVYDYLLPNTQVCCG